MKTFMDARGLQGWLGLSAILVLATAIGARVIFLPAWGKLQENRASITDLRVKLADARDLVNRLPEQEERVAQARLRLAEAETQTGGGSSLARILDQLDTCAENAGVRMSITQESAAMQSVPIKAEIGGSFFSIGRFFSLLAEAPFAWQVNHLSLEQSAPDQPAAGQSDLQARLDMELLVAGADNAE